MPRRRMSKDLVVSASFGFDYWWYDLDCSRIIHAEKCKTNIFDKQGDTTVSFSLNVNMYSDKGTNRSCVRESKLVCFTREDVVYLPFVIS